MYQVRSGYLNLAVAAAGMILWASVAVSPATAAPFTFSFSGAVGGDPSLISALSFPATVSGTYTLDFASPTIGDASGGYDGAVRSLTLHIGTYTAILDSGGSNFIQILQFPNPGGYDQFSMKADIDGPAVNSVFHPSTFFIDFIRPPGVFGNASTQPSISGVIGPIGFRVVFDKGLGTNAISGTGNAVPLPPAAILFGAGIVALIGLGARNWRRASVRLEVRG